MAKLTTTSYAILSLLAAKPWNAAELVDYMQKSALRFYWPRAGSGVYAEPKKLVEKGLATSRTELVRRRERSVYRITAKGRRELRKWLLPVGELSAGVESEFMVKVLSSTEIDIETAHQHARHDLVQAIEFLETTEDAYRTIAAEGTTIQERIHFSAIGARDITRLAVRFAESAAWYARHISAWSDTQLDDEKRAAAIEIFEENVAIAKEAAKAARAALEEFDQSMA